MQYKGIILAGGSGTRLYPLTLVTSKQLLPVYDKPMIYYPLTSLMLAGIREYPDHLDAAGPAAVPALLGDGAHWGLSFDYAEQPRPGASPRPFMIGRRLLAAQPFRAGSGRQHLLRTRADRICCASAAAEPGAPRVFAYHVNDPERYGVVRVRRRRPRARDRGEAGAAASNYAVTGLYFYDERRPRHRAHAAAFGARRAGDHRLNSAYLRARRAARGDDGARLRLARHGHARVAAARPRRSSRRSRRGRASRSPARKRSPIGTGSSPPTQVRELAQPLEQTRSTGSICCECCEERVIG